MRPPRILILVLFFAACLFLLCRAITTVGRPAPVISSPQTTQKSGFKSLFSFSTPFTLFPPNAIITIADDNSTSFAARPAAFGPPLPGKGMDGQLWIGSGFTEESLQNGEGEGELGCSDVPGWDDGTSSAVLKPSTKEIQNKFKTVADVGKTKKQKRSDTKSPLVDRIAVSESEPRSGSKPKLKPIDDGTDDYLHQNPDKLVNPQSDALGFSSSSHADIQSIQEGAEIAGKIVLLSRGGCGFLEKVKWAQRRGAIALIVGDNQRGGPLIQMYAHGDTSNVTIPSIFTSRTTAYLLSLMMQPGSFIEDIIDENGKPSLKVQQSDRARKNRKPRGAAALAQPLGTVSKPRGVKTPPAKKLPSSKNESAGPAVGWLSRVLNWGTSPSSISAGSRPPSSGQLDWVIVEDFSDEKDKIIKTSLDRASKARSDSSSRTKDRQAPDDHFQIGVEDWRDPDLVGSTGENEKPEKSSVEANSKWVKSNSRINQASGSRVSENKKQKFNVPPPMGGRVTPNSGEYAADHMPAKGFDAFGSAEGKTSPSRNGGLISKILGDGDGEDLTKVEAKPKSVDKASVEKSTKSGDLPNEREGLWVVITPSSGASPFFDTLLVLVISPLITLTVVYALLILRARIRRRRWRAPKSVVEQLPVRTYHTVASTPSRTSRVPSPASSSPTTPLLQSQHGPSRPRPRSRTTTSVPSASELLQVESSLPLPRSTSRAEHEKRNTQTSSEWKKYMSRQVECVVCLEEYVDGVSQVMSLPCGHEFHVDCITPWLITRRRTCPICKGDVVRSLARGMPSSPRYEPYQDDSDEDLSMQATSSSSSNAPLRQVDDTDIEQGTSTGSHRSHQEGWFGTFRDSLRVGFLSRSRQTSEDINNRDR
ncbi:uncharacterized protein F4822DRAFT_119836 [Hypoxylon trugodes]|uniref:uncharacterized protein n=1 Tax=Hypoxylon trugodes TaxID=326681 RepID=UPI00218E6C9A|nr:uncharacterized protein F4822DRAFT_119836 [Hypoxylon trugodes]KAI1392211.1 hypothetical protein F4822DRAFT_119836 [Hypoxylon trugodes]